MKRVYLVGPITEDQRTHQWRKEAIKKLGDKFDCDDPCASKFDRESLKEANGDAKKSHTIVEEHQAEILLPKSFQSVSECDIMLVNFSIEPSDRPMIGSLMEIAWGYDLHKSIIAVRGTGYYSRHPMIIGCVHAWGNDLDEAIEIIKEFYTIRR